MKKNLFARFTIIAGLAIMIFFMVGILIEMNPPENFKVSNLKKLEIEEIESIDLNKGILTKKNGEVVEAHGHEDLQTLHILRTAMNVRKYGYSVEVAIDTARTKADIQEMTRRIEIIQKLFPELELKLEAGKKSFPTNDFVERFFSRYVSISKKDLE